MSENFNELWIILSNNPSIVFVFLSSLNCQLANLYFLCQYFDHKACFIQAIQLSVIGDP